MRAHRADRRRLPYAGDRRRRRAASAATTDRSGDTGSQGRKIKAQLFYVSDDGMRLVGVERDVPYAEQPVDQAREI